VKYALLVLLCGCATAPTAQDWDRCNTGRVIDACNPADYPPLTDTLPRRPGARLLVPIEEAEAMTAKPVPQTPEQEAAGRWLQKLGK
jgi:hypothetical protein